MIIIKIIIIFNISKAQINMYVKYDQMRLTNRMSNIN